MTRLDDDWTEWFESHRKICYPPIIVPDEHVHELMQRVSLGSRIGTYDYRASSARGSRWLSAIRKWVQSNRPVKLTPDQVRDIKMTLGTWK